MAIDTGLIQKLRETTGAGILDAKNFLEEAGGDFDKAVELARKKGQKVAAKKADRQASEGIVHAYIHGQGRVGVLVKLNCETDFVARNEKFTELAQHLAMHVAAFNPTYITRDEVAEEVIAKEKEIYKETLMKEGKPEEVMDKIMEGKLNKFFSEVCLMEQEFLMDDKKTVQEYVTEKIAELGENIQVSEVHRVSL